jgi:hypothetical protein
MFEMEIYNCFNFISMVCTMIYMGYTLFGKTHRAVGRAFP